MKTSETANKPISVGMKGGPSIISIMPKVKRGNPEIGSKPIDAISSPKKAAIMPLINERPEIETMTDRPKIASAKYSTGPNSSAKPDTTGEAKVMIRAPTMPPKNEANSAMDMARPASPRRAIG